MCVCLCLCICVGVGGCARVGVFRCLGPEKDGNEAFEGGNMIYS